MKHAAKLLILVLAFLMVFSFASCGEDGNPEESNSDQAQSESGTTKETTYTVTFHYGVKTFENDKVTEWKTTKVNSWKKGEKSVSAPTKSVVEAGETDYRFLCWVDANGNEIQKSKYQRPSANMDVYASYRAAYEYTVTFKSGFGSETISTVKVKEGQKLSADQIPSTQPIYVYYKTSEPYKSWSAEKKAACTSLFDCNISIQGVNGDDSKNYFIETADKDRLGKAIMMLYGQSFQSWISNNTAKVKSITSTITDNVTFTVQAADAVVIPKVDQGTIVIDGVIDEGKYALMGNMYKNVIAAKVDGAKFTTSDMKMFALINQYATADEAKKAAYDAAISAGKTEEEATAAGATAAENWTEQDRLYKLPGSVNAELYMAWDGDYIYFAVKVYDSKIVTEGKDYCSINNPYENDGVEMWYGFNNNFSKICLDAAGWTVYSGASNPSKYLNFVKSNNKFATRIYNADNSVVTVDKNDGSARVLAEGEGSYYIVEYVLPAFHEPTDVITEDDPLGSDLGGKHWGQRMITGTNVYVSMQVDCVSDVADAASLEKSKTTGSTCLNSESANGQKKGGATGNTLRRSNFGWQTSSAGNVNKNGGTLSLVLG